MREWREFEGDAYFKVREMSNIKCENLATFLRNKNETYFFTSIKPNIMKKSKYQHYFNGFINCMLVPYTFWFNYQQNMVFILWLLCITYQRGGAYQREALTSMQIPKCAVLIRGSCSLEARRLSGKIWKLKQFPDSMIAFCTLAAWFYNCSLNDIYI